MFALKTTGGMIWTLEHEETSSKRLKVEQHLQMQSSSYNVLISLLLLAWHISDNTEVFIYNFGALKILKTLRFSIQQFKKYTDLGLV